MPLVCLTYGMSVLLGYLMYKRLENFHIRGYVLEVRTRIESSGVRKGSKFVLPFLIGVSSIILIFFSVIACQ